MDKTYLVKHLARMSDKQLDSEIESLEQMLSLAKLEELKRKFKA